MIHYSDKALMSMDQLELKRFSKKNEATTWSY